MTTEQGQLAEIVEQATIVETPVETETETQVEEQVAQEAEGQEEIDWKARAEKAEKKIQRQRKALSALQQDAGRAKVLQAEIDKLKQAQTAPLPKIDDFETTDQYLDAKAEHLAEQKANEKLQKSLETQQQSLVMQAQQERDRAFQVAEFTYVQQNPSYQASKMEVRNFLNELQVDSNSPVIQAIYEQADVENNLPAIIDYFGKNDGENLGELERIVQLSPVRAAVEIAGIQAKLRPQATTSPLPKPIKPVTGGAKPSKSVDDMSGEELMKKYKINF